MCLLWVGGGLALSGVDVGVVMVGGCGFFFGVATPPCDIATGQLVGSVKWV